MAKIALTAFGLAALLATAATAYAVQLPAAANHDRPGGKLLYERYCAGCHDAGPGHPGTMLLEQLGRPHPPLIGRSDLEPDFVRAVVRNGLVEMPPFRPTELTDGELDQVIAHILSVKPAAKKAAPKVVKKK